MSTPLSSARRVALCLLLLASLPLGAIEPAAEGPDARVLPALRVTADAHEVTPSLQLDAQDAALLQARVGAFTREFGSQWKVHWDRRADRPNLVQGQGIPLLPGRGNALDAVALGVDATQPLDLAAVEKPARALVERLSDLLGLRDIELQLDTARSTSHGAGQSHWFLEFGQFHRGIRVDGAFVHLRVAHGNVVQFGAERIAAVSIPLHTDLKPEAAFELAWSQLGFPAGTQIAETLERGELRLYPRLPAGEALGMTYTGPGGYRYTHQLAWRFVFRVEGDPATWQVLLDANSKRVIDVRDLTVNADATVRGGIFPTTNTDAEISVAFPYTAVSNGGNKVTNASGVYDYTGGTATSSLDGQYFRMVDNCGAISLANNTDGNLDFGASAGTDCITPGFGGAGNTHASRTGFYHLTLINEKARAILPTNPWLQGKVTANMNIQDQCNASWNGQLNFFRSGGGCSNTGELAAVFLHEWGHGMDSNSGGSAPENASGEAVGDTFAFLETRDSCIGPNFRPGQPCFNCTTCTGVRDVQEFSLLGPPTRTIARPDTIGSDAGQNCDRFACPYSTPTGQPYRGPMGFQGHCESLIASSANWDLTQSLVDRHGEAGWSTMDDIWYSSLVPSKSAFRVASGGQCNVNASVDGCGATNWYTVYLAADDDNGNLADGTPNACRIWDAFDAHGIACGTRPECTVDAPDFTLTVSGSPQRVCVGGSAQYGLQIGANAGFTNAVTLSASGLPGDTTALFTPNPVTPVAPANLSVAVGAAAAPGSYDVTIQGAALASAGRSRTVQLLVDAAAPQIATLLAPANRALGVSRNATFSWQPVADAQHYSIEVARDVAFTDIVASASNLVTTSWSTSALDSGASHYWRVRAHNACGDGQTSAIFAFTTAASNEVCRTPNLAIPDNNVAGVSDALTFTDTTPIQSLRLKLQISHSWVGDVVAGLTRSGTTVVAMDRPGVPASTNGCANDNVDVVLDDGATNPVESACAGGTPTIAGVLRPNNPLTPPFAGTSGAGAWTLNVSDRVGSDVGTLTRWCVETSASVASYGVGGFVSGLGGPGLVLDLNDGAETLAVAASGDLEFLSRLLDAAPYSVTIATQPSAGDSCVVQNGSGTVQGADVGDVAIFCGEQSAFFIGGTVGGLLGDGLVLALNGSTLRPVAADGSFQFTTPVADSSDYEVTVQTQPSDPSQVCSVANGSDTVDGANVTDIVVSCVTTQFDVGGNVAGLVGSGLRLALNGAEELPIGSNGGFTFTAAIDDGQPFAVTVVAQPTDPSQVCAVSNGSGTLDGADVANVAVNCVTSRFAIGGQVTGLAGSGLRLAINGGEEVAVAGNGSFVFATTIADGANYAVAVVAQPLDLTQVCSVGNGSGTVDDAAVNDIGVSCVTSAFAIGGSVDGLAGSGLALRLNDSETLPITADGNFVFDTEVVDGQPYAVTVATQPGTPNQQCSLTNADAVVDGADVGTIEVDCVTRRYAISGTVTGLLGGEVDLRLNGGETITIDANGPFAFATTLDDGSAFTIEQTRQTAEPLQRCTLTNASGGLAGADFTGAQLECVELTIGIFAHGFED